MFAGQSKGKEQSILLVIEEIGEGYSVVEFDVCSGFLDGSDGELRVFKCDDFDKQGVVFCGFVDCGIVEGEYFVVAGDFIDFWAFGFGG